MELRLGTVCTGPSDGCTTVDAGYDLELLGLIAFGTGDERADHRSAGNRYCERDEDEPDHPDLTCDQSTTSPMITISAITTAVMILTLLYGRCPCTSPVTPLMYTWNGRSR